jgi:peptide/nickel transport system substrate-binding protein
MPDSGTGNGPEEQIMSDVNRRKYLGALGTALGVGMAGCSNQQDPDAADAEDTTQAGTSDNTGGDQNTNDGSGGGTKTLTQVSFLDPFSLDPALIADIPTVNAVTQAYDQFLTYDSEDNQISPHIATDWDRSGNTYTFQLREDVTFHSGRDLTAQDVKYTIERVLAIGGTPATQFGTVLTPDSVVVEDDYTISMTTSQPTGPFLDQLSWLFIVDSELIEENASSDGNYGDHGDYATDWINTNSAGSGPFQVESRSTGDRIVYSAYEDYWKDWPDGHYDRAVYQVTPEVATIKQQFNNGTAQMSDLNLSVSAYQDLMENDSVNVEQNMGVKAWTIHMNTQHEVLGDADFRRAISYAVNYGQIGSLYTDAAQRISAPIPDTMWGHNPDIDEYSYDPEMAQQHFDAAGVDPNGVELDYHWVAGNTIQRQIGLQMQSDLQEYGITLNVNQSPWSDLTGQQTQGASGAVDMSIFFWNPPTGDPSSLLYRQFHSQFWSEDSGSYYASSLYENSEVDQLLEEAQRSYDRETREQNYQEAQQLIMDDAPVMTLYNQPQLHVLAPEIEGYNFVQPAWTSVTQRMSNLYS